MWQTRETYRSVVEGPKENKLFERLAACRIGTAATAGVKEWAVSYIYIYIYIYRMCLAERLRGREVPFLREHEINT